MGWVKENKALGMISFHESLTKIFPKHYEMLASFCGLFSTAPETYWPEIHLKVFRKRGDPGRKGTIVQVLKEKKPSELEKRFASKIVAGYYMLRSWEKGENNEDKR